MTLQKIPYKTTITKEEINALPLKFFSDTVCILTTAHDLINALKEITLHHVVGFDTETRPSFQKGEYYHVSLMQLALPNKVFLVRLNYMKIPDALIAFLENSKIMKVGVGLQNDITALHKVHPFKPHGFVDLALIARRIGLKAESLKKLAGIVLKCRISKGAQVSNWESTTYTKKQIRYAATDSWICLVLYEKLVTNLKQPFTSESDKLDINREILQKSPI